MVDAEGIGFKDFTAETAISGIANISGNIVSISGSVNVSGSVCIIAGGYTTYKVNTIQVTSASGGQALGSGLTISGFLIESVTIQASGILIGGYSGNAPHSGFGWPLNDLTPQTFNVTALDEIYAISAVTSGLPLTYIVGMKAI